MVLLLSCKKKDSKTENVNEPTAILSGPLKKVEWLVGDWGNTFSDGSKMTETWSRSNDSTFSGITLVILKNDTVFYETVSLEERAGKLNYVVSIPGQKQEKPVSFEMTSVTERQLIFENPKHDFPNKITYIKIENDSLVAEISGVKKGKVESENFPMKKLK